MVQNAEMMLLIECANAAGAVRGYPTLSLDSEQAVITAWLQRDDPDGIHSDEARASEDCEPLTTDEAWDALRLALVDCHPQLVAERIKAEIVEDLKAVTRNSAGERMTAGRIKCFSDLHDFVDANMYGETHPAVIAAWATGDSEVLCSIKNAASAIVDAWLQAGGHKVSP